MSGLTRSNKASSTGHDALQTVLGYAFADAALLQQALTHRSAGNRHNERLEFLGDAIVGAYIAENLYRRFPEADEGQLTRLRASLVKRDALAEIGHALGLGRFLQLGTGERKSAGWRRDSTLANTVEALFGAAFLDGGWPAATRLGETLFAEALAGTSLDATLKDPKTRLQEYLQAQGKSLPAYRTVDTRGAAHAQVFTVECSISGLEPELATGSSRRKAEQAAAAKVLDAIGDE